MIRVFGRAALLCLLVGCSLFDDNSLLLGSWGGYQIDFTASPNGLLVKYNCYTVEFPGPVYSSTNTFTTAGKIVSSTDPGDLGAQWRMSGAVTGDTLKLITSFLQLGTGVWIGPDTAIVVKGQKGVYPGYPCLE